MTARAESVQAVVQTTDIDRADRAWAALAPLIAARPTMRLWAPEVGFDKRVALTQRRPDAPAAVMLFRRRRTRVLAFDLDAKLAGAAAVDADRARLMFWLSGYGAKFISDRSTSGGAHIVVPLARAVTVDQLAPFMRAAAALYPTLDIKPMTNPDQGCLTVPGSATREGGFRVLDGELDAAVEVLTQRNHVELFDDLVDSIVSPRFQAPAAPTTAHTGHVTAPSADYFEGDGAEARLLAVYRRTTPIPASIRSFAETGAMPPAKQHWSPSEARQSVLVHSAWRGYSLSEVRARITDQWSPGLGQAYQRYRNDQRDTALRRDWAEAMRFVAEQVEKVRRATHRKNENYTGGKKQTVPHHPASTTLQRRWLAHAIAWCDVRFRSDAGRWMKAAVLQALGSGAAKTGRVVNGTAVVRVGGRSLSIGAGLVSEASVWAVLRELRDTPGSPILLEAQGSGKRADSYALVTPDVTDPDPDAPGRPELVDVHPVWATIGLRYRRAYEVLQAAPAGLHPDELATAARMSRSCTYEAVSELARVGLVLRGRGNVRCTTLTLDELGDQLGVFADRAARIAGHQASRVIWHEWLLTRGTRPTRHAWTAHPPHPEITWTPLDESDEADYLDAQMRTGPPPVPV
ncbi:hypothetical protein KL864_34000 [Mycolicibacterium goodii]|uniref:hypothetical protein n=1 Tax=Mycolicibacterium goodii TaxID=134601 RepID=UPI001BDBC1C5|nr:hypothetical protein [Mycolicibacterium goodii]MBU8820881.1 hypothetical protein [Mycolicibacterium goodii]